MRLFFLISLSTFLVVSASRADEVRKLDGDRQSGTIKSISPTAVTFGGSVRDTVMYSILRSEWPAVRTHLKFRLARQRG